MSERIPVAQVCLTTDAALLIAAGCGSLRLNTPTAVPATSTAPPPSATPPASATVRHAPPTAMQEAASPPPVPETPTLSTETSVPPSPPPSTRSLRQPSPVPRRRRQPPKAVIHTFEASIELADPGETITLTWHWTGGERATIYHLMPTGQLSEPYWNVGQTGSVQYTISPDRRNRDTFVLFVGGEDGVAAQATVQVLLRCPDVWFFSPAPDICPAAPATVGPGAEQHFERGVMLWVGPEEQIYVLYGDEQYSRWSAYADRWEEGDPVMDPSVEPPPGLQQPVRGFGLLWREDDQVRERLGWAVAEERGYQKAMQRTSHVRYPDVYIRAADGGVWKLRPNGSAWEKVALE